jgi:predicted ATP-grasp superfamily ATP-dependent carboligase
LVEDSLRIFAYEHITGGGLTDQRIQAALAPEGAAMLHALVSDLVMLPDVQVVTMRGPGSASAAAQFPPLAEGGRGDFPYALESKRDFWRTFRRAVSESDAVWLIAPEQDGVLERLSREVVGARCRLLGSSPDAVHVAASKLSTADALLAAGIRTIPTFADEQGVPANVDQIVVKPDDGAGCQDTYLFHRRADLRRWLRDHDATGQIFQPYIHGTASSLSIVCCEGRARLLSANRQHVAIRNARFEFSGVSVNAIRDSDGRYAKLAQGVARALPGLWGYVGIDVIDGADGPIVVEINPRLTTAYAGLRRALGINVARLVLELPGSLEDSEPLTPRSVVDVEVAHAG